MFLDEKGEKISKSKGNGLSIEEWLSYGSEESLAFFAFREPKAAKKLHIGVVPKAVDEYLQMRGNYPAQDGDKKLGNPVHHVHVARGEDVPEEALPVNFGLMRNIVGVMGADSPKAQNLRYLRQYVVGGKSVASLHLDPRTEKERQNHRREK